MEIPNEPFPEFPKIPRLNRDMLVKLKLDGTNSTIYIQVIPGTDPVQYSVHAGSKNKWIAPGQDNFGFATWVEAHKAELVKMGAGLHRGEWYGAGINGNRHHLKEKRFAIFDHRFLPGGSMHDKLPACCEVAPVLYSGPFDSVKVNAIVADLRENGFPAYPGAKMEGVVVWLPAAMSGFKVTCENDEMSKGEAEARAKVGQ